MIDSLVAEFDPGELESVYRSDLRALLEAKLAGAEIAKPEPVADEAPVIDLMDALRASVAASKKSQKKPKPAAKTTRPRKTAAASRKR